MPRPLPPIPRLRRRQHSTECSILLGCPRISPEWEIGALRALIKPQTAERIRHLHAKQGIPPDFEKRVMDCMNVVADRLGYRPTLHWPAAGDYLFLAEVEPRKLAEARALGLILSRGLPSIWIVLGRLFLRDGQFYRRERGFRLNLVLANNVHLTRPIRSALNGML